MIYLYQMDNVINIINCFSTISIVLFAFLQWKCSNIQRKTILFKYRVQHIQDLKAIWIDLYKNIDYISGYRADYIIPEGYSNIHNKLFKKLDDHLAFTRGYFENKIYKQEQKLIELLSEVIPSPTIDATIYHMNKDKFEIVNEEFKKLCNSYVNTISCE